MKLLILVMAGFLCVSSLAFAEETAQDAEVLTGVTPKTSQVEGNTTAVLGPAYYPMFYDFQGNDPVCEEYLKTQFKVQTGDEDDGVANSGFSLAPIYLSSVYGNGWTGGPERDFELIPGLKMDAYKIPEENRKTAGVLVTWTVRIEGARTDPYDVRINLCSSDWEGTTYQAFPGGDVKTMLYANGKPMGQEACMTIPDGGKVEQTETKPKPPPSPGDPTHTGSYLITPDDFNGLLPAEIDLEIRWKNETCQQLTSPENMRSMIVTFMPVAEN